MSRFTTTLGGRPIGWLETIDEEGVWPNDTVIGTPGDDRLHGGDDNDDIDGLAGADTMSGRLGDDTYHVDNLGDLVREKFGEGIDTVVTSVDWTLGRNVENLSMVLNDLTNLKATGNRLDNFMSDNYGSNLLDGGAGNDTLDGGRIVSPGYSDTLMGGTGDDLLQAGRIYYASDRLEGGAGDDILRAPLGGCMLFGGEGNDLLDGGAGGYHQGNGALYGGLGRDTLLGGALMDGGSGDDLLQSTVSAYRIIGGDGRDTIEGVGGAGYNDLFVDAGVGRDSVDVMALNNGLTLYGGDGNDSLRGSAHKMTVDGGDGNDVVSIWGTVSETAKASGGDGNDTISSSISSGHADLDGGEGDDVLVGRSDNASMTLIGGAGNDTLSGTGWVTTLTGGDGEDLFVLLAKEVTNSKNLVFAYDFASGIDRLGVSRSGLSVGNGDLVVDGATTVDGPGGFDASAELVVVTADVAGSLSLASAAAAIGSADQAYAAGQTVVFLVDNGTDSLALYFQSSGADTVVSANELSIIGHLYGTPSTSVDDVIWTG